MHFAPLLVITALFLNVNALKIITSARCGKQSRNNLTCKNSTFRNCCSKAGYCGSTSAYCGTGCQKGFGDCTSSVSSTRAALSSAVTSVKVSTSSITSRAASSSTVTISRVSTSSILSAPAASSSVVSNVKISTDGSCGGMNGYSCLGSAFGYCCSEYGWCGSTDIYCGSGCNATFGSCNTGSTSVQLSSSSTQASSTPVQTLSTSAIVASSASPSSMSVQTLSTIVTSTTLISSAAPTSTQKVSTDAQCGPSFGGVTCLGSGFGDCCSEYSWCGSTSAFCGTGCQDGFGKCDNDALSSSPFVAPPGSTVPSSPSSTSAAPLPIFTCGVEGFADNVEYYASSFNLIDTTDVSTCATLCLTEPTCMSYLFNPTLQNCAYLVYSLEQGNFIATDGTDQLFWERACGEV